MALIFSLPLFLPTVGFANNQIVVLGDSLSSGYKMDEKLGWVNLIHEALASCDSGYEVVNLSVSGDTTRSGLSKIKQALKYEPKVLVLELGGNDGLRGLPIFTIKRNLEKMIKETLDAGSQILLIGIQIPPNYGSQYTREFHKIYTDLASEYSLPFVEFLLDGVALNDDLMLADGIHPNAKAQPIIANHVWPSLKPLLSKEKVNNCSL